MYSTHKLLIDHAYKHVWCGPGQDSQHIVSPTRISPERGALWSVDIDNSQYNLPSQGERYDVFAFSDILPNVLGLEGIRETWVPAENHMKLKNMYIYLFNVKGEIFPLRLAWFLYTKVGNLVVALKRSNKVPKWVEIEDGEYTYSSLFVRYRTPAYFRNDAPSHIKLVDYDYLEYRGNTVDYQSWRNKLVAMREQHPYIKTFLNGKRVRDYNPIELRGGDHLEWYHEEDIRTVIEYRYDELQSFESEMDSARKFLLNRDGLGDGIDYVDDIDVFIKNYTKPATYTGIYYHQSQKNSIRMVTHRDYALMTAYVHSAVLNQGWSLGDDIRIELTVRYSGYNRALVDEAHRIKELFKLDPVSRLNAMVGSDTGVDVWKASNLENSMYLKLMSAPFHSITEDMVIQAYGYNAVANIVGMLPLPVVEGERFVNLKYSQQQSSTVYEYDQHGRLLGSYHHKGQSQYALRNPSACYIEAYSGIGDISLDVVYNTHLTNRPYKLDDYRAYRFYISPKGTSGVAKDWEDVTGNNDYYSITSGNEVMWTNVDVNTVTAIKNDLDYLSKEIQLPTKNGSYLFSVGTEEIYPDVSHVYEIMTLKPGEYDVYLNGWDLVEGIDFYVNWPEFCIVNKRYLETDKEFQTITIRARGFCTGEIEFDHQIDSGFVIHNQLSRNARYNIRDDKVTRMTIGGSLRLKDEVGFAEDGTFIDSVPNGTPYKISHPYIPLLDIVPMDTYEYRQEANIVDGQIEGYMDEYHKEDPIDTPNPIPERYPVISPFISKIMEDMLSGFVTTDELEGYISVQDVKERFKGYTYLLEYDPVLRESREDLFRFLPHQYSSNVQLNLYQYRVLDLLIRGYLNSKIELNRYVTIIERV